MRVRHPEPPKAVVSTSSASTEMVTDAHEDVTVLPAKTITGSVTTNFAILALLMRRP